MTKQKHATRTAFVAAGASALLLVTGSGPEAAWAGSTVGAAAPVRVTAVAAPLSVADPGDADAAIHLATAANHARAAAKVSAATVAAAVAAAPPAKATPRATPAKATAKPTASKPAKPKPKPAAVTPTSTKPKATPKPITISRYTNAPGSQAAVDDCKLVLWTTRPMWLAAHNHCGYQWLATVPTGTVVTVTTGVAAGTYVVTGHIRLARQSGSLPAPKADLVLQTCVGTGTGFTLARRVR